MRKFKRSNFVVLIFFLCAILGVFAFAANNAAYAIDNVTDSELDVLCKQFTSSLVHDGQSLGDYESYINQRFQIGYSVEDQNVSDEQIMKFVPKQLFDMKAKDFSYVGDVYGFYFNYNAQDETYLVYFFKHVWDTTMSGHLTRKIALIGNSCTLSEEGYVAFIKNIVFQNPRIITDQ